MDVDVGVDVDVVTDGVVCARRFTFKRFTGVQAVL